MIRNWWHRRIIRKSTLSDSQWHQSFSRLPLLDRLSREEKDKLRRLAIIFLYKKEFTGAQGLHLTNEMTMLIALQACLPILNLGIEWYRKWSTIIIYPDSFVPQRTYTDASGVVHQSKSVLGGEAWLRGPVILSWEGVISSAPLDGSNLAIHEFVHKLDMLNGAANGFPPLHSEMEKGSWSSDFSEAFEDLQKNVNAGVPTVIDHYAATEPAEFFAVLSEVFFERPDQIFSTYPPSNL